jgi:hypothetical protein
LRLSPTCIVLCAMTVLCVGCGHLSRGTAARILQETDEFERTPTVELELGRYSTDESSDCDDDNQPIQEWASRRGFETATHSEGWIDYELTPSGKTEFAGLEPWTRSTGKRSRCPGKVLWLPLGTPLGVQVTGISENGASAEVEFSASWKLTVAGRDFLNGSDFRKSIDEDQQENLDRLINFLPMHIPAFALIGRCCSRPNRSKHLFRPNLPSSYGKQATARKDLPRFRDRSVEFNVRWIVRRNLCRNLYRTQEAVHHRRL